jgi:hypothetical protein
MVHHPFGSREHGKDKSFADRTGSERRTEDKEVFKGLCVNCANRHTCLFPKPEGGVWHCEEYLEER